MIGVTGVTGQLGRLVIDSLLKKTDAENVVALVRSLEKAGELKALGVQVRQADYSQPETLVSALAGVSKLLLISGSKVGQRIPQHQAVIDAAKSEGVELLAYTSILKAIESPILLAHEHKVTEEAIAESGVPAVILRNGWYTENYTQSIAQVVEAGVIAGSTGQGKIHTAARADYAEAAAVVLTTAEPQAGKVYELSGSDGFTLAEYAQEIAAQAGQPVTYQDMSGSDYTQLLVSVGLPEGFAEMLADAEVQASKGWLADNSGALSELIGRPTTPLADSVKQAL